MQIAPFPQDESARLNALSQYQILDSEPEFTFDDLTHLAASICATPIALISLIDTTRQWFKSRVGLNVASTSRDIAFCSHTILQSDVLVIPDALADERFATNPLVLGEPNIRFYAGAPLITPSGHAIGSICVIDRVPRGLNPHQLESLRALSRQIVAQLELRRKLIESECLTRELQHNEQNSQLLKSVTQAIVTSPDFHSALQVALEKVCEATQWEFGEAWVPSLDKTVMEASPAWYSKTKQLTEFRRQSEAFTFAPNVGIPGRVWATKQTEWHQNVSLQASTTYLRAQLALEAGLKATLGFPLLANDEVIAVLVFYMFEARQEDQRLIDLIAASTELGLFIQRKQTEEEVRKSLAKEQELNQFKSNFIASLSHELRTPLTSILGLSDVLIKQHFGSINAKQAQYLSMIHSSGNHLLSLINDLLDLAKIEAGKQELYTKEVDVEELCQNAIEVVAVRAVAKQQQLSLQLPVALRSIVIDQQRGLQILLNYLSNAIKFTPRGGMITLRNRVASGAEFAATTLPTTDSHPADTISKAQFLVLEVSDTGSGIPCEKQHLLFQSFQQIDVDCQQRYQGTGLGLTLAKQLAELHGGGVSFTSVVGVGSTFSVWLPI